MKTSTLSGMFGFLLVTSIVSKCSATATDDGDKSQLPSVPLIDLGPWITPTTTTTNGDNDGSSLTEAQQEVVRQVYEACRSVGFFQVTNHGLDTERMDHAWTASEEFFDLAVDEKLRHKTANEAEYPYGYEQSEQLSKGKQLDHGSTSSNDDDAESAAEDLKETFAIGPNNSESGMPSRRWVDTPTVPTFQSALERYYEQMESLAMTLLKLFAFCLEQPADFFEKKMDHHMAALRLVHYYPLFNPPSPPPVEEPSEIIRAGAHTDYGALTILNAKSAGLQVLLPPVTSTSGDHQHPTTNHNRTTTHTSTSTSTSGTWHSVPVVPGALVINLGDLMQRWTNDRWVSTLHRVVMPSTDALERRYSMAYFVNINGDTLVEALLGGSEKAKYPPIMAKDHLMAKHLASMGQQNDDPAHEEL
jgi:isopenicillin N synthase-like dioxygenase